MEKNQNIAPKVPAPQSAVIQEPDYIEEHEDFKIMKRVYTPELLNLSHGVWKQAFDFLKDILYVTYGSCKFGLLVSAVEKSALSEAASVSINFTKVAELNEWSPKTTACAISNLKKILKQTTISPNFINKLTTVKSKGIDRKSDEYCLPGMYKKFEANHPVKKLLLSWIEICKKETRNKSQSSVQQIIQFAIKLSKMLDVDLYQFVQERASSLQLDKIKNAIDDMDLKMSMRTKQRFAAVIIKNFYKSENITHADITEWQKSTPKESSIMDTEHDAHRISNSELELMFEVARQNTRDLAIFLLMATTGLRVGGVSGLLLKNVATQIGNDIIVLNEGRTLEKGRKWFTFVICERLKIILHKWITEERNVLSDYLFPGQKQGPLSTSRISKIIKDIAEKAGVSGTHVHAHAIRHSFAHILLEAGNDPGLVGKMMGHSSSKTTEKFYLKETAAEASKRCNIPWLTKDASVEPLPSFMATPSEKPKSASSLQRKIRQSEKRKALKLISKEFSTKLILPTLPE
jgi:site-specific recombinase XerD